MTSDTKGMTYIEYSILMRKIDTAKLRIAETLGGLLKHNRGF
jgi:hypothetical protein